MSKFMTPPLYNNHGLENQLKNLCFNAHDLVCGCENPQKHLQHLFEECHHTEDPTPSTAAATVDAIDGLDEGTLEKLFAEDADDSTG